MTEEVAQWRVNPETPSVIITPHGRIAVNWSVQRAGCEVDYTLAEETAAMIVRAVNAHLPTDLSEERAIETLRSVAKEYGWSEIYPEADHWQTSLRAMQQYAAGLQGEVERLRRELEPFAAADRRQEELAAQMGCKDGNAAVALPRALLKSARTALGDTQ